LRIWWWGDFGELAVSSGLANALDSR
jgi:hypothetical protein